MALLDAVAEAGAHAPGIWPLEAVNRLVVAERRGRINPAKRAALTNLLRALPIAIDPLTALHAWDSAAGLARDFQLFFYDATYLELARRRGLPLATLDRRLGAAAGALGIVTLGA